MDTKFVRKALSPPPESSPLAVFARLLRTHMQEGTRPADRRGSGPWQIDAFADAIGVSSRTVQHYRSARTLPPSVDNISKILFGDDPNLARERSALLETYKRAYKAKFMQYNGLTSSYKYPSLSAVSRGELDEKYIMYAVGQGVFIRIKGQILLTSDFLRACSERAQDKNFIDIITRFRGTKLTITCLMHFLFNGLRKGEPFDIDELKGITDNCAPILLDIAYGKLQQIGVLSESEEHFVDPDALSSFTYIFLENVPPRTSKKAIRGALLRAWREVLSSSLWPSTQERDMYQNMLAIVMYAMLYDSGHYTKTISILLGARDRSA